MKQQTNHNINLTLDPLMSADAMIVVFEVGIGNNSWPDCVREWILYIVVFGRKQRNFWGILSATWFWGKLVFHFATIFGGFCSKKVERKLNTLETKFLHKKDQSWP